MHWGHARTKDFIHFEELPVALSPDTAYDKDGCWSGTAVVKDGVLWLFYACIRDGIQAVAAAYSADGVHFEKYAGNPVIPGFPPEGSPDFRDPAVCFARGRYWCVMASGNRARNTAVLLLYESGDLLHWQYRGVLREWENAKFAECPSFVPFGDRYLLAASVCRENGHRFSLAAGRFENGRFTVETEGEIDKGPDQYAGQIFRDGLGRALLLSWIPGWNYAGYREKDIGCFSVPREITCAGGKLRAYPAEEVRRFLLQHDPAVVRTQHGFYISRQGRSPVEYRGEVRDLKILRDGCVAEVFVNGGEEVYTALL